MTVYAPSKRRRFRNAYRSGEYGPNHLKYGRGKVLSETKRTATMTQVTGLTATAGSLKVDLKWGAIPDANLYLVQMSPDGVGTWSDVALVNANIQSTTITGLTASVIKYFRVCAQNGAGSNGSFSANASATPTA
jgi:hypothetical protein